MKAKTKTDAKPADPSDLPPRDEWTLLPDAKEGDEKQICFHKIKVLKVIRREVEYSVCKVQVGEAVPIHVPKDGSPIMPPSLKFSKHEAAGA